MARFEFDSKKLNELYTVNQEVKAICDMLSASTYNKRESKVDRLRIRLKEFGHDVERSRIVSALKELEKAGCGDYIKGSRGTKSKFLWEVQTLQLADQAIEDTNVEEFLDFSDELHNERTSTIEHTFHLRPGHVIEFSLPTNLSRDEGCRLGAFFRSVAFDQHESARHIEIEHKHLVRPNYYSTIDLPGDLTDEEAYRLGSFAETLSFEAD